jgi:hypothetical protein
MKKQIMQAVRSVFNSELPDERYKNILVSLDYPLEETHYPAIFINYAEGPLRNVGVGSVERVFDDNGVPIQARHAEFQGALNFNVLALNPVDRDNLSAVLINILNFGRVVPELKPFFDTAENGQFVQLQMQTEEIQSSGEQTSPVPWGNNDELIYGTRYSVNIYGDFYSDVSTGQLITISNVVVTPYRPDQPVPW